MKPNWPTIVLVLLLIPLCGKGQADSALAAAVDSVVDTLQADDAEKPALTHDQWATIADDTIAVRTVRFDSTAIAAYRADPELDYDRDLHVENLWWDRFLKLIGHWLEKIFGSNSGSWVFGHLDWIIFIIAAAFLIFFFRKRLFGSVFAGNAKRARQVTEVEEDIEKLDLDKLLATAEKNRNWRLALRYHYLKVLRKLVDEGRIEWQPRYTDQDYLRQLKEPALRATFGELSFLFKWVWYGDAPVDEQRYRQLSPDFVLFHTPPTPRP